MSGDYRYFTMSDNNFRSELEMWCDLWDDAQEQGVHPAVEPPKSKDAGFSGDSAQDDFFDYLDADVESDLLQEEKVQNPVYPDSVGADNQNPPPRWVKEDLLKEVESLKNKLYEVENKLAKMGGDKKWLEKAIDSNGDKKLMSEIESLRKKIDNVSSHLGIEDESSPWEIKRD
jgi:hypothetical protein